MSKRTPRVEVYKAADGWRWRFLRNGRVRADGGQGYARHIDCIGGMCDSIGVLSVEAGVLWRSGGADDHERYERVILADERTP